MALKIEIKITLPIITKIYNTIIKENKINTLKHK